MRKGSWLAVLLGGLLCSQVAVAGESPELLSVTSGRLPLPAYHPVVSGDGRWAAFSAYGALVPDDRNNVYDIYVRNLASGALERVSVGSGGEGNGVSQRPVLSADGRFVLFESYASNLAAGDGNGQVDVFLHDRATGETELVSVTSDGRQGLRGSFLGGVSNDGRYVAFNTVSQFDAADPIQSIDVYVRDRQARTTRLVAAGVHPALSGDGRVVAMRNGSRLFLRDLQTGAEELIAQFDWSRIQTNPSAYIPAISSDGRYVAYEGWSAAGAPLATEVFVYDRTTRSSEQLTRRYDGAPLTAAAGPYGLTQKPQISGDGRFVLFFSSAADLVQGVDGNQLYLHDRAAHSTTRLTLATPWRTTLYPLFDLSDDAGVVVFQDTIMNQLPQTLSGYFGVFALRAALPPQGEEPVATLGPVTIVAEPAVLWPPNSKLVPVTFRVTAPGAADVEVRIADEYGTFTQTLHDSETTVPLEAWRQGSDQDGRNYTVTAVATSASGQQATAVSTVSVPHDRR